MRTRLRVSAITIACASLSVLGTLTPRPASAGAPPLFRVRVACQTELGPASVTGYDVSPELTGYIIRFLLEYVDCVPGTLTVEVQRIEG